MFFVLPMAAPTKANVVNRIVAKFIDIFVVFLIAAILPYPVGPLSGFFYSLFADGINRGNFRGQSLGKKLMRLKVVNRNTKKSGNFRDSILRNSPVGVATFFAIIPIWGWLILALIGIPLMIMEVYLMFSLEKGHRLGDVMGDTEVIEVRDSSSI